MIKFIAKKLCGYDALKRERDVAIKVYGLQMENTSLVQDELFKADAKIGKLKAQLDTMTKDRDFHRTDAQQLQKDVNLAVATLEWVVEQETPHSSGTVKKIVRRCREIAEQLGV